MRTSEFTDKIDAAKAKALADLANPKKTKKGITRGNKTDMYADLAAALAIIRPVLGKHNIALHETTEIDGQVLVHVARLACQNQWIESIYPVCQISGNHTAMGAALSYARRYNIFPLVGVAGEDDDTDGKDAADPKAPPDRKAEAKNREAAETSGGHKDAMLTALEEASTLALLAKWEKDNKEPLKALLAADRARVVKRYKERKKELERQKEAAE